MVFQYPLADRVGFWGSCPVAPPGAAWCFSILLRIELVFGGPSSTGNGISSPEFQYPLADRVGFWGPLTKCWQTPPPCFSILLRIELVFGGPLG